MAELVLRLRDREMGRVAILKTTVTVGRDQTSDLAIDNAAVSRTHASVSWTDGVYRVRDEDSENGITLNGKRVRKAALEYGDIIGIGKFEIEFVDSYHEPMQRAEAPAKQASANVMKTMSVDAATAARFRDEALAKIAAAKGLPAPTPKAPPRPASHVATSRAPAAPAPTVSSTPAPVVRAGLSTPQIIMLVVGALVAGVVLTLLIAR